MDNKEKKNNKHDEDKMPLGENSEINKNNEKINKAEDINEELKQKKIHQNMHLNQIMRKNILI